MIKNFKKILIIISFSILFILFLPNFVKAYTWRDETTGITWEYNKSGSNATCVNIKSYTSIPETLVIPEKMNNQYPVIEIGNPYANNIFNKTTNVPELTKIVIPDTVEEIFYNAFYNLSSLTEITLSKNLKTIGYESFFGCSGITSLVIPNSVTELYYGAFSGCSGIKSLTIPVTVSTYSNSFKGCNSITNLILTSGTTGIMPDYTVNNYNSAPWYSSAGTLQSVCVSSGVKNLGNYSFYSSYKKLTTVTIEEGFEKFGSYCFCKDTLLRYVDFPDSIKYIGDYSFQETRLEKVDFKLPEELTYLGEGAFYLCKDFLSGNLQFGSKLTEISFIAFWGCEKLNSVTFPDNIIIIKSYAFARCGINSVVFSKNLKTIEKSAFAGCASLGDFVLPDGIEEIQEYAFSMTSISNIVIPESITKLNSGIFRECTNLKSVEFKSVITSIDLACFSECTSLQNINFKEGLIKIEQSAFYNCVSLKTLSIPTTVEKIGDNAFYNCELIEGNLDLINNIKTVGDNAFYNCYKLNGKLILGEQLQSIASNALFGTNFTNIEVYCEEINKDLFKKNISLKRVFLGENVKKIGDYAFANCYNLEEINLENGLLEIGKKSFCECKSLKGNLIIPDSVTYLGSSAFENCTRLNGVIIGNGLTEIKKLTFKNCDNVKKIIISNSVKVIGMGALAGISEAYYQGYKNDIQLLPLYGLDKAPYFHYQDCVHDLNIKCTEGYEIINKDTQEIIQTSKIQCGTRINIGVRNKSGYNVNDVNLCVIKNGEFAGSDDIIEIIKLSSFENYLIEDFNRNYSFKVLNNEELSLSNLKKECDFVLRTYIDEINFIKVNPDRKPTISKVDGEICYKHIKTPIVVNKDDIVTFNIRVYNEGNLEGNLDEISVFLPEGLELFDIASNKAYGWSVNDNGKITTEYFKNTIFSSIDGDNVLFKEIPLICKVVGFRNKGDATRLVAIAEISKGDMGDKDSVFGQINSSVSSEFKLEEANQSTADSFIKCDDDDTDFENIILKEQIPITYSVTIKNLDEQNGELLKGATYVLKDIKENEVARTTTDENGILNFESIVTYGKGTDVYYLEQVGSPEKYESKDDRIEINVIKTIVNEDEKTYTLVIDCSYAGLKPIVNSYIPIYNREQLEKIGSNETLSYDETDYVFSNNANYKLMNDIDLAGKDWKTLNIVFNGVLFGNGCSIKNLTIRLSGSNETYSDYTEIGLFRILSGNVYDLNFDNVNIQVSVLRLSTNASANTITGKYGVGTIAGFMYQGEIKNCTISGNLASGVSNTGGFIGHTAPNNYIKFENCTSNLNMNVYPTTGYTLQTGYNAGGIVGCSLGSIKLINCSNEGNIQAGGVQNVGGLVGFSYSSSATAKDYSVEYDSENKNITIGVPNKQKEPGEYNIVLENRDLKTLGFLEGARYTVYNYDLTPMEGMENIELDNGSLNIATIGIDFTGIDTYYIKEVNPPSGYEKLDFYVKLVIKRYWDAEAKKYRVSVDTERIKDNYIDNESKVENTYNEIESVTGIISTMPIEIKSENINNAIFVDCYNNGQIVANLNSAGLLGASYCNVSMSNCKNFAQIVSSNSIARAGGLIAEIKKDTNGAVAFIQNCLNSGYIITNGGSGEGGGLVGSGVGVIQVFDSINKSLVNGAGNISSGGIVGNVAGIVYVKSCTNEGRIQSSSGLALVGGIVGRNRVEDYSSLISSSEDTLGIENCLNIGNLESNHHMGGIIGFTSSRNAVMKNNINRDNFIIGHNSNIGGIIGLGICQQLSIDNCKSINSKLEQQRSGGSYSYGSMGGIIGAFVEDPYKTKGSMTITNCDVLDNDILGLGKEAGGIAGTTNYANSVVISKCNVERCYIRCLDYFSSGKAGGICATCYNTPNLIFSNCYVKSSTIECTFSNDNGNCTDVGGLVGLVESNSIGVYNCGIENCIVNNDSIDPICSCTGGAIGYFTGKNCTFSNVSLKNNKVKSMAGPIGGVCGIIMNNFSENAVFNNTDVVDCMIISTAESRSDTNTGGFLGSMMFMNTLVMNNCNIYGTTKEKMNIVGKGNVGGLVGSNQSYNLKLNNCNVKDLNISGEEFESQYNSTPDNIAGFIGYNYRCS